LAIRTVCLPDRYIQQASPEDMYADAGMSAAEIAATAKAALGQRQGRVVPFAV
jgi:1-deoxy-D-xylulose-5-phosphate synthase